MSTANSSDTARPDATTIIDVGGSSETYEMLELLADAYSQTNAVEFEFSSPSQTSGGIAGVKADIIDVGGVSRKVEASELGEQLTYIPMVETPLVIVVHGSVTGISDITADQIKAIYSGEITRWQELGGPDEPIILFDLSEDENEKVVLREAYLGEELEITSDAVVFTEDDELLETLAITEFSIAAIPQEEELEDLPLTTLSIDGISPTPRNIQSGDYAMLMSLGIVISPMMETEVQAFVDFAMSLEGRKILAEAGYLVAPSNTTE